MGPAGAPDPTGEWRAGAGGSLSPYPALLGPSPVGISPYSHGPALHPNPRTYPQVTRQAVALITLAFVARFLYDNLDGLMQLLSILSGEKSIKLF